MVETLWFWHASPQKVRKHLAYQNLNVFEELKSKNRDVVILFGHYCNWEWNAFVPQDLKAGIYDIFTLYTPLRDKKFDEFTKKIRENFGVKCVTKKNFLRTLVKYRKNNDRAAFAFIADQSPWGNNVHYWTKFLNRDTTFLTGWEYIAHKFDLAVIYVDMQKVARGKYIYRLEILCENPADLPEFSLTEKYVRRFEQNVLIEPSYWLWTHKRWKVKKM
jgi:KDO2-lipid IV(A) lauroyltransferase